MGLNRLDRWWTFWRLNMASHRYNRRMRRLWAGIPPVQPLSLPAVFLQKQKNAIFDVLKPYWVRQFNDAACSVASVATVLNAVRVVGLPEARELPPITQADLLDRVDILHWKARVSRRGYQHSRGLTLSMLRQAMQGALDVYGVPYVRVDAVPLPTPPDPGGSAVNRLRQDLHTLQSSRFCFIIAHFNQGMFTGDIHLPHISPVGAYDPETDHVLVMDVDPEQQAPYWVPFNLFCDGLASDFNGILTKFGYTGGGYIWIDCAANTEP